MHGEYSLPIFFPVFIDVLVFCCTCLRLNRKCAEVDWAVWHLPGGPPRQMLQEGMVWRRRPGDPKLGREGFPWINY